MLTRRWAPVATALRHSVAAFTIFAQLLVIVAPLADAREAAPLPPTLAAIFEMGQSQAAVDTDHGHQHQHDSATCPACIAQTIVADVATPQRGLIPESGERARLEHRHEQAPPPQFLSLQRSRAPPAAC